MNIVKRSLPVDFTGEQPDSDYSEMDNQFAGSKGQDQTLDMDENAMNLGQNMIAGQLDLDMDQGKANELKLVAKLQVKDPFDQDSGKSPQFEKGLTADKPKLKAAHGSNDGKLDPNAEKGFDDDNTSNPASPQSNQDENPMTQMASTSSGQTRVQGATPPMVGKSSEHPSTAPPQ